MVLDGFENFVPRPEFQITIKENVSKIECVSVFRSEDGSAYFVRFLTKS
jgi:hypothetical protein